ncbi:MAG: hypothetical protein MRERV_89c004 [Mycoplasmataceae bacterium RV_VA103A]|nr:MAG: hypothetical protein MRERV_89c004 [Mycoplasmataceae bacterium RV_VA103A]
MPEYERKTKEAHKKLLKEKKPELFNRNEKQGHRSSNIEFNITEENGKMQLTFYKKGETGLTPRVFSEDRIDIQPEYYETIKITHAEGGEKIEEKTDKLQPTTGWIIFFFLLVVALLLVAVFWKKIWKWIRGEREQEKKVKEQLDIF